MMLHFIAAHKIAAAVATFVIAGSGAGISAKQSSDAANAKAKHALVVKQAKAKQALVVKRQQEAAQEKAAREAAKTDAAVGVGTQWVAISGDLSAIRDATGTPTFDQWSTLGADANGLKSSLTALRPYLSPAQQVTLDENAAGFCDEIEQAAAAGAARDYVTGTDHLSLASAHIAPLLGLLTDTGALDGSGSQA